MGYTHYYYVAPEFDAKAFSKVATDFKKMITPLKHLGVILADGMGENYPLITPTEITFNGMEKCGHTKRDLGITWPAKSASGISKNGVDQQLEEIVNGSWFAGAQLESRVCSGDCSHETFSLSQKLETVLTKYDGSKYELKAQKELSDFANQDGSKNQTPKNEIGKYFQCTKTAYKPYDIAVTLCLVIAKHHLGEQITIQSDGTMENWHEAMILCHHFLGYGKGFCLDDDTSVPLDKTDAGAIITQYNKNKTEITSLQKTQEKLQEEKGKQIEQINNRYDTTISELQEQKYVETRKIRDEINTSEEKTNSTIDELSHTIHQTERTIYYLKRDGKTLDKRFCDSVKNGQDEHQELVEEYTDGTISLQMYIVKNGRPTNKYSLMIVGNCILGGRDYESILKLPYEYLGWRSGFDSYNNIQVDTRQFKTIQDAKQYHSKNNIKKILKKFFAQYYIIKAEYEKANTKYVISDFEDIVRGQFSTYWKNTAYRDSEKIVTAAKLGIDTIDIHEMSFEDVLRIAENYGV